MKNKHLIVLFFRKCFINCLILSNILLVFVFEYWLFEPIVVKTEHKCNPINKYGKIDRFTIENITYPRQLPLFLNESYNFTCLNQNSRSKVILFWNYRERIPDFYSNVYKTEFFNKSNCPVTNCEVTNERTRLHESDFVLFMMYDVIDVVPEWSVNYQRWVFVMDEPPNNFKFRKNHNNLFHLTATYRNNSNFMNPYLSYFPFKWALNNNFDKTKDFMANKTEFAFQLTSHCETQSKREILVQKLQKFINVDVYGRCGKPCPNDDDVWVGDKCKNILSKKYKFYFAFENALCSEYVTEKFFSILNYDIIPVVYGLGNYDTYIPKSGFVNVFDFDSPKHLAEYLIQIASNNTLYNSFFKWKRYITRYNNYPIGAQICEMCIWLNLEVYNNVKWNIIENFDEFWNIKNDCQKFNMTSLVN